MTFERTIRGGTTTVRPPGLFCEFGIQVGLTEVDLFYFITQDLPW
jgi:hypothetical protein